MLHNINIQISSIQMGLILIYFTQMVCVWLRFTSDTTHTLRQILVIYVPPLDLQPIYTNVF